MDAILDKTYRLATSVQVGKFTVVVADSSVYVDGCQVPAAANAAIPLGVAQESIIPDAIADYKSGQYSIVSGTAWPTNSIPASAAGRNVRVRREGITHAVASGIIARGDRCNVADSQGRIKTINESAGTVVYEVCEAEEAAAVAGDVIRVRLTLITRKA